MFGPKTLAEARTYRYGTWAGNPNGSAFRVGRCFVEVYNNTSYISRQCSLKAGEDGLCHIHRKLKAREE